jgi:hypothetical protein
MIAGSLSSARASISASKMIGLSIATFIAEIESRGGAELTLP